MSNLAKNILDELQEIFPNVHPMHYGAEQAVHVYTFLDHVETEVQGDGMADVLESMDVDNMTFADVMCPLMMAACVELDLEKPGDASLMVEFCDFAQAIMEEWRMRCFGECRAAAAANEAHVRQQLYFV